MFRQTELSALATVPGGKPYRKQGQSRLAGLLVDWLQVVRMTPRVIEGLDRWPYGARGTQNLADRTKRLDIRILAELLVLSSEFCALRALNRIRLTDVSTPLEVWYFNLYRLKDLRRDFSKYRFKNKLLTGSRSQRVKRF